ncbi:1-aminocyclopropane-1-carboxylate oxidase homolog 1-like [Olea europaea subsp. europaea]|uniref:1-aminocyclopropane-1-carboxylate oxidase homolog 1-like n=1 Tax=Olea europaea subsp. europaea TaxID=158383 RepID=A0A8S0RRS4_OLEEU|nr:1-aminocyclopropane-1-carboxylate oxidase homolog 1-like [Olea europaea subsp. europaea]
MVVTSNGKYEWAKEMKEFDETKAGVKGLVDAGISKIPQFFVHPPESLATPSKTTKNVQLELPTIDFEGVQTGGARRKEVVEEIRKAAGIWGFFRIVNHGVPLHIMDAMLEAVKRFHEQPVEEKKLLYSADSSQRVKFNSNGPLREYDSACWRDILTCVFHDDQLDPEAIPLTCRKEVQEYVKCMIQMREIMAELLSEALGLSSDHLSSIECMKSEALACLYYPICPEPEKTLGTDKHSDTTFLTLLMQDTIGGLQILHDDQWVDVPPVRGALIANIGDLMQIISNDKFISVEHRVLAQPVGPRISVACFFTPSLRAGAKPFAPIKEILSVENPALYREFLFREYCQYYKTKGQDVTSALPHFRIERILP